MEDKYTVMTSDLLIALLKTNEDKYNENIMQIGLRIKNAFYYEFDELIPSIMADKIDEIIKEFIDHSARDKVWDKTKVKNS